MFDIEKNTENFNKANIFIEDLYKSKKINNSTYILIKEALINAEINSWLN